VESLNTLTRDVGPSIVRVGVYVGKHQDYSAIVVTEQVRRDDLPHSLVRSIERLELGTAYPAVVDRVALVMERLHARAVPRYGPRRFAVDLILDATGVGLPIADMLRERGLSPRFVLFTGSDKTAEHPNDVATVSKGWLVSRMQVLLQGQRLHLPRTVEAGVLVKELKDYRISVNDRAHASYPALAAFHLHHFRWQKEVGRPHSQRG